MWLIEICRDSQYLASTRPFLHLPTIVFSPPHFLCLVTRLRTGVLLHCQIGAHVHLRAFLSRLIGRFSNSILCGGQTSWSRSCRSAWAQTTAGPVWATWRHKRSGSIGIRLLFRRLNSRILPALRIAVHCPVRADASDQPPKPRVNVLRQSTLPCGWHLLEPDHLLGIQRATLPSSYSVTFVTDDSMVCDLAGVYSAGNQPGDVGD